MTTTYDTAVIGLGAMGSATLYHLAKRGKRAIGFDQFEPGHDKGSSHGESRIIRLSYYEDLSYVPLLHRAYDAWRAFETTDGHEAGSLLTITGILEAGHPGSQAVANSLKAARHHGLPYTELDAAEIGKRFPAFRLPSDWHGQFQPDGGYLRPELAIRRYVSASGRRGADVRANTRVRGIEAKPGAILVHTDDDTIEAGSLVVAAGAWIGDFAPDLQRHLTITRQVVGWFPTRTPAYFTPDRCPVFILEAEDDHCYGFPDFAGTGVKAASHWRGATVAHPDTRDATVEPEDEARIARMFHRLMPEVGGPASKLSTCLYTRTPDAHFFIDHAPDDARIVLASPCSGHGFKFASLFGTVLADMAEGQPLPVDMALFRLGRVS